MGDNTDKEAVATETITAEDDEVKAVITVEVEAPDIEPAAVVCQVLAGNADAVASRVFGSGGFGEGRGLDDPVTAAERDAGENQGRIMDWEGGA